MSAAGAAPGGSSTSSRVTPACNQFIGTCSVAERCDRTLSLNDSGPQALATLRVSKCTLFKDSAACPNSPRPSAIHGTGLFAVDPITRGTAIWRLTPGFDLD